MEGQSAAAFGAASRFFVEAVRLVPPPSWTGPGLGRWTVLDLVAHANRAHTTLARYLAEDRAPEPVASGYFSDEAIAQRGREAVAALGDDPARAVGAASATTIALVGTLPADTPVWSPVATTDLATYLPSRTAELTVHGLDIVRAVDASLAAPPAAVVESLRFVSGRLVDKGFGDAALLALAGRGPLPPGLSAY